MIFFSFLYSLVHVPFEMIRTAVDSNCTSIPKFPESIFSSSSPLKIVEKTMPKVPITIRNAIVSSIPEYTPAMDALIAPLISAATEFSQYVGSKAEKFLVIQGYSAERNNSFCHYFSFRYNGQLRSKDVVAVNKMISNIDATADCEPFIAATIFDYDGGVRNVQTVSTVRARQDAADVMDALAPALYPYLYNLASITSNDALTPIVAEAVEQKYAEIMKQMRYFDYDPDTVLAIVKKFREVGHLSSQAIINVMQKKCQEKAAEAEKLLDE